MQLIRWALLVPALAAAWWATAIGGMVVLTLLEQWCPPEHMVSGACRAGWYRLAEEVTIAGSAGLSAALVVVLAILIAPSRKLLAGWLAFGLGAMAALYMGVTARAWIELAAALGAGGICVAAATLRWRAVTAGERGTGS